jgi:GMP synthase-like glutamine amidotransferase
VEINTYKDIWPYYSKPLFWQSSFSVIEPWEHVGEHNGVEVRASQNFYNFFSRIMGSHTMVFPIYSEDFEIEEHDEFVAYLNQSACIVVEGGDQSTYDSDTFVESLSQKQLFAVTSKLILSRGINTCPQIYICLGHQCTAEAHVSILKEFVTQMEGKRHFKDLSPLIRAADDIRAMGESVKIIRRNGDMVCQGWEHPMFAVRNMLQKEIGLSTLEEYTFKERHISEELVKAYKENEVFFSKSTRNLDLFGRSAPMFHGDEVNPEAIYFANWAYLKLHPIVEKCKQYIIGTSLVWLLNLPCGVRILASSVQNSKVCTSVASTQIYYKKIGFPRTLRTYTVQFHPELITEEVGDLNHQLESDYEILSKHGHILADMVFSSLHD